jgi:hypothetical protein
MYQVDLVQTINGGYKPVVLRTLSASVTAPPVTAHFSK